MMMKLQSLVACQNKMKLTEFTFSRIICNGPGLEIVRVFALFQYPPLIKFEDSK